MNSRDTLRRMWEWRRYLILLARFTDSRSGYFDVDEYVRILGNGADGGSFLRFFHPNNSFLPTLMHYWGLKSVPLDSGAFGAGISHKITDKNRRFLHLETELVKAGFIELTDEKPDYGVRKIRLKDDGRDFVKFFPFYEALQQKYPRNFSFFLGGGLVAVVGWILWLTQRLIG